MWAYETAWLSKTHTVVRYDLRAHGQSDTATAPFSHLGDLIALLDELKIAKATLIGLSAGAAIALDAALEIPDRVERIVLSGPAPSGYVPKDAAAVYGRCDRRAEGGRLQEGDGGAAGDVGVRGAAVGAAARAPDGHRERPHVDHSAPVDERAAAAGDAPARVGPRARRSS